MARSTRTVRRGALVAALGITITAVAMPATAVSNRIPLNTGQETTASNTGARGSFTYTITGSTLCYTLVVKNLSEPNVLGAHIHVGDRRTDGPVVVPLSTVDATSFTTSGCVTPDPAVLAGIEENPRDYYVNVHTENNFPGGEIRGQLIH